MSSTKPITERASARARAPASNITVILSTAGSCLGVLTALATMGAIPRCSDYQKTDAAQSEAARVDAKIATERQLTDTKLQGIESKLDAMADDMRVIKHAVVRGRR